MMQGAPRQTVPGFFFLQKPKKGDGRNSVLLRNTGKKRLRKAMYCTFAI